MVVLVVGCVGGLAYILYSALLDVPFWVVVASNYNLGAVFKGFLLTLSMVMVGSLMIEK